MNNILIAIAGFICAVLLAAIFVPFFIDWNNFKSEIEQIGSDVTGHKVEIVGDVNLRILPQPVFETGGIKILNEDDQALIDAKGFVLELDFPTLLKGQFEITRMRLDDGQLLLLNGENSLNAINLDASLTQKVGLENISINKLELNNIAFASLRDGAVERLKLSINQAELTANSLNGPFKAVGSLDFDENDVVFNRKFSLVTGRFRDDKPLSMKFSLQGEHKRSRLKFGGNLVNNEDRMSLIGKLNLNAVKGESLIGFGSNLQSSFSDKFEFQSDFQLNSQGVKFGNINANLGEGKLDKINQNLKLKGEVGVTWRDKVKLEGGINLGLFDFKYFSDQFIPKTEEEAEKSVIQTLAQLNEVSNAWLKTQFARDDNHIFSGFEGNLSFNIDQIDFDQNNVKDHVRQLNALLRIDAGRFTIAQFAAKLPGNSELKYTLSQQLSNVGDGSYAGVYGFNALHLRRFTNWLLFKHKKLKNIDDFWELNGQFQSAGTVEVTKDQFSVNASQNKNKYREFQANYVLKDSQSNFEIKLDRLEISEENIKRFSRYIAPFVGAAINAQTDIQQDLIVAPELFEQLGDIKLHFTSPKTYLGIREVGSFDLNLNLGQDGTNVEQLAIISDKVSLNLNANLVQKNSEAASLSSDVPSNLLDFKLIDSEMKVIPQLFFSLYAKDNEILAKLLPKNQLMQIEGSLRKFDERGLLLEIDGQIGTSKMALTSNIVIEEDQFVQQNLSYQLNNDDEARLIAQFAGEENFVTASNLTDKTEANIQFIISRNEQDPKISDVKISAFSAEQNIDFIGQTKDEQFSEFDGEIFAQVKDFGKFIEGQNALRDLSNGINGQVAFEGNISKSAESLALNFKDLRVFDNIAQQFNAKLYDDIVEIDVVAERFKLGNLFKILLGFDNELEIENGAILDASAQNTVDLAASLLDENIGTKNKDAFYPEFLKNHQINGQVKVDSLELSQGLVAKNALVKVKALGSNQHQLEVVGDFYGSEAKLIIDIAILDDGQISIDANLSSFKIDVANMLKSMKIEQPNLSGIIHLTGEIKGNGFGVKGLLSHLKGEIDLDLANVKLPNIDAVGFNEAIKNSTSDALILSAVKDHLGLSDLAENVQIKLVDEKINLVLNNGHLIFNHPVEFIKPLGKKQNGRLFGQIDFNEAKSLITLNIPLSDEFELPALSLSYKEDLEGFKEFLDQDSFVEFYKVKMLEQNVDRLEQLQVEIKRKNDAEILRYQQEKEESRRFKEEIRVRVEKAIDARKLNEIAQNSPIKPPRMPYLFVGGDNFFDDPNNALADENKPLTSHQSLYQDKSALEFVKPIVIEKKEEVVPQDSLPSIVNDPIKDEGLILGISKEKSISEIIEESRNNGVLGQGNSAPATLNNEAVKPTVTAEDIILEVEDDPLNDVVKPDATDVFAQDIQNELDALGNIVRDNQGLKQSDQIILDGPELPAQKVDETVNIFPLNSTLN